MRLLVLVLLCAGHAAQVAAQAAVGPVPQAAAPGDGRRTLSQLLVNIGSGLAGVFDKESAAPLLIGSIATGAAALTDQRVREAWQSPDSGWATGGEVVGGAVMAGALGGLFVVGRAVPSQGFRAATYDLGVAALVNQVWVTTIKLAVGRERPDDSNSGRVDSSFPSGHTATAFAAAAVMDRHASWKVSLPLYGLAAAIGVSRIQRDAHYLSDVAAGATLGIIVGHSVVRMNGRARRGASESGQPKTRVAVAPLLGRHVAGVRVTMVF
jgi:membrane-associated phospholipid phosphatase